MTRQRSCRPRTWRRDIEVLHSKLIGLVRVWAQGSNVSNALRNGRYGVEVPPGNLVITRSHMLFLTMARMCRNLCPVVPSNLLASKGLRWYFKADNGEALARGTLTNS